MNIHIWDEVGGNGIYSLEQLVQLAPEPVNMEERLPGVSGKALDVSVLYAARNRETPFQAPTHMKVEAADEFQACIPWDQLGKAAFLYEQEGAPLKKGYPLRLYVPDGSSECLNVKSVRHIWFLYDESLGIDATYGFKNTIAVDELRKK